MSYQVLSRRWRPKKFQDVVGQEHITRSLQNAIRGNRLGHAYILSGTRGIGKTSVARIFAKSLRCENRKEDANSCGECPACLDFESGASLNVQELDGASHNRVEDIRDLISTVQTLPTTGRYKIYIIDEVHMLSVSAFNALLKTLEEPPEHVVFIFATTEPEKLLDTVLSRCQRFDFRNASVEDTKKLIVTISAAEGITFASDDLVEKIAIQGKGSLRDTLSLLDQVLSYCSDKNITDEAVVASLGLARTSSVKNLIQSILAGDSGQTSVFYNEMLRENVAINNIVISTLRFLYEIIENIDDIEAIRARELVDVSLLEDISGAELFWIYENISIDAEWATSSFLPEKSLELVFQKIARRREILGDTSSKKKVRIESRIVEKKVEIPMPAESVVEEPVVQVKEEIVPEKTSAEEKPTERKRDWGSFLDYLREESPASASNLEQGNIINPVVINRDSVSFKLGFSNVGRVFYDYLSTKEVQAKLVDHISTYFITPKENVNLSIELLGEEEKEEKNFKSMVEINQEKEEEELKNKETEFLCNPMIKEAEKIFNGKVDKIKISK